jgi:hypothetical protein
MKWVKNTAGKPDSQLTMQLGWNGIGMLVVVLVVGISTYKGTPITDMVWYFLLGAMGIKGATYVSRRNSTPPPVAGEDLGG